MLDGEDVYRREEERPDFVRKAPYGFSGGDNVVIGIEHFRVDHFSMQKKNGKVASTGIVHEKNVNLAFDKCGIEPNEADFDKVNADIIKLADKRVELLQNATYNTFIGSFQYSLDEHLKNIDAYRKNIGKLTHGKIEIALLIEVHSEFTDLFLNDNSGTRENKTGIMPMFVDVINLLEKIDKRKVNYVVLCLGSMTCGDEIEVRAFWTGDIKKQLAKQKIKLYKYAGDDCLLTGFKSFHSNYSVDLFVDSVAEKVVISCDCPNGPVVDELRLKYILYAAYKAHCAIQSNVYYATTMPVLLFLAVYDDYILRWKHSLDGNGGWKVKPELRNLDRASMIKKLNDFAQKWELTPIDPTSKPSKELPI